MCEAEVPSLDLGSITHSLSNVNVMPGTVDTTYNSSGYITQIPTDHFKAIGLRRSDTLNTLLPEFNNKPDITLKCEQCGYFVDISNLKEHRKYHASLLILKYKGEALPETSEELFKRRNQLIKKINQAASGKSPPDPQSIQIINEAYEHLKSYVEDTFEEYRQIEEDVETEVNSVALNCSPSCVYAVGIASSANRRWKTSMEDTRVFQDCFGDDPDKCYLGIFDGHNGHFAAEAAAEEFHKMLLNEMSKFDPKTKFLTSNSSTDENASLNTSDVYGSTHMPEHSVNLVQQIINMCEEKYQNFFPNKEKQEMKSKTKSKFKNAFSENMSEAYKKAYQLFDILLSYGKDERSKVRWSGCSALQVMIQNTSAETSTQQDTKGSSLEPPRELGLIHLANAGNVNCILVRGNRSYRLNKLHTPDNDKERQRVLKAGGVINMNTSDCRVNGVLSTTRGLGNHGDVRMKKSVLVEPYTTCVPIDQYAQFLVMASNGVWEVFSDEEVASLLLKPLRKVQKKLLPCNQIRPPSELSESVADLIQKDDHLPICQSTARDFDMPSISVRATQQCAVKETLHAKTVIADLHTEVGSHVGVGDDFDISLHDEELLSLPINCDIPDHKPQTVADFRRELAKSMSEYLVQAALLAGARDNITVMITLFPGSKV